MRMSLKIGTPAGNQNCMDLVILSQAQPNPGDGSYSFRLATDQARIGCPNGPEINWRENGNDVEITIDPNHKTWK
jgi:hypothetical protein